MTICCRHNVIQSKTGDAHDEVDKTKKVSASNNSSEPDYEPILTNPMKHGHDTKVKANPAYHCNVTMVANPSYKASGKKSGY